MGCTGSKPGRRDQRQSSSPQFGRSYSLPVHDIDSAAAAARRKADHVVSLTSTTLGSLRLDYDDAGSSFDFSSEEEMMKSTHDHLQSAAPPPEKQHQELLKKKEEVVERAKAWSEMIERRIPAKTPTVTPPNEPEAIDAWELMAGLEDAASPIHRRLALLAGGERRAHSFNTARDALFRPPSPVEPEQPQWMQLTEEDSSILSEFDPEILSSFRMALEEELSSEPQPPEPPQEKKASYKRRSWSMNDTERREIPASTGIVRARVSAFQQKIDAKRAATRMKGGVVAKVAPFYQCPPEGKGKVVFYFTSLRGVRKTYEDCWTIKVILKGCGVRVDERDVSMHAGFKAELIGLLDAGYALPRVFADGNYLGGAEEVRHLHEAGELNKFLEGCEAAPVGKGGGEVVCQVCGDMRFVPCETCSGSCKVYVEEEEEGKGEEGGEHSGGFRRCPDCNENGLVRCPLRC